jgi:hypothetical protein
MVVSFSTFVFFSIFKKPTKGSIIIVPMKKNITIQSGSSNMSRGVPRSSSLTHG